MSKKLKVTRIKNSRFFNPILWRRLLNVARLFSVLLMIATIVFLFVLGFEYLEGGWRILLWVLLSLWLITIVQVVYCHPADDQTLAPTAERPVSVSAF